MQKVFFFTIILAIAFGSRAQTVTNPIVPLNVLLVNTEVHDFGQIPQGIPVYYTFEISNIGKTAVKFDNVTTTCGCTTPEWSKEEFAPGKTSTIKVGYNAGVQGYFEKYVNITYNGSERKQLTIKGNVWKAPDESAPANASVQFLNKLNN